ncbi:hypothetical protein J1N10_17515 [Carboxylicivirga sp. A043]|uniref:hypothetical protein n=1 Tax=Carboxylicivirga litoralis TaxID=2816963 RepID=UPI0021CB1DE7|nr:hypothetical protein [Carboxylicivirga sp. A043]MCU4157778.1 hypothetical protein [Carboxylicivirga sp. A043]
MKLARIGSPNTYVQALKDLQHHKFIRYDPSFDPNKGSEVYLYTFDTATCTPPVSKMIPSINYTNNKQTNTLYKEENFSISNSKKELNMKSTSSVEHHKSKCSPGGAAQRAEGVIPPLQHIKIYFHEKGHPESEAQRFFNYYESNGWLIGGKTPMKDWKAAARNWMLNIKKFEQKASDTRKKQFQKSVIEQSRDAKSKHLTSENPPSVLRPTSPQPSSSNYDEPL